QAHTNTREYLPNMVIGSASILTKLDINNELKLSSIESTDLSIKRITKFGSLDISSMSNTGNIVIEYTEIGLVKGGKILGECYLWMYHSEHTLPIESGPELGVLDRYNMKC
ncbi:12650_t:CDS:2, partial [Racocetra persica]